MTGLLPCSKGNYLKYFPFREAPPLRAGSFTSQFTKIGYHPGEKPLAKITMQAISKIYRVSLATVFGTIHSPHLIRNETRERINHVMAQVNYVYHATAGDLLPKRSSIIGVIIPTANSLVFSTPIFAIQETAREHTFY